MTARGRTGGRGFFCARAGGKKPTPRGCFYRRSAPRSRHLRRRPRGKEEQPSPAPSPGEKIKAPTPSDSHARRTRALISQVKRPVRSGHNGTAIYTPHVPRLKRSALKRYVRAVPSRASGARPPADQGRKAVSVGRRFRLARSLADPEQKIARRFPSGADSVSPDPNTTNKSEKPFEVRNP